MNRSELIEQSKGIVNEVYDSIGKIESMEKLLEAVKEGQVIISMPDGQLVDLNVLTEEQFLAVKQCITDSLEFNMMDSSKYLERIIKSQKSPVPDDMADIDTSGLKKGAGVEEVEIKIHSNKKYNFDVNAIKDMYVNQGLSYESIAKKYGCSGQTILNFVKKHGITRGNVPEPVPEKPKASVEDNLSKKIPEIKAMYTNGPFTMKMLAEEFHVDVKVMHDFCSKKGLLKVGKKDPFNGK